MIELAFDDSTAGGLKEARAYSRKLGDVICLNLMLDIGDIRRPKTGKYRAELIYRMWMQNQWGSDEEAGSEIKQATEYYAEELARLKQHLRQGEPIRMWTSMCPYSVCAELWLSELFAHSDSKIYLVDLPGFIDNNGTAVEYASWAECTTERFVSSIPLTRQVSRGELLANAMEWQRLVKENSPLRAVITDRVTSVPASFYDFLIWKYLDSSPIKEAVLIGKILGENQLGVGDWWYAQRIEHFIRQKRIAIIEDNEQKYARVIARA